MKPKGALKLLESLWDLVKSLVWCHWTVKSQMSEESDGLKTLILALYLKTQW